MRLKQYLIAEKTFNIDRDVDHIYRKAFKKFIDNLQKTGDVQVGLGSKKQLVMYQMESGKLKEEECKAAHALNPIMIYSGISPTGGSYYKIDSAHIWISLQKDVIQMIQQAATRGVPAWQTVPPRLRKSFKAELSEGRMKATIYHELSHWLNDTLHNYNITNIVRLAQELGNPSMKLLGKKSVDMTHFEIDAQIHGIKQLKRTYKNEWDSFTFDDILDLYPSLRAVTDNLFDHGRSVVNIWTKAILKRMAREKLLGKNMRGGVKPQYPGGGFLK